MANMTQQMALDELYNRWFQIADHDRDGRVMGQEAVVFLSRSGLPPATLGKIWEVAAQGAPWLDQASFRRVCQLMWYAQQHGNDLPADSRGVVMKIISGMATLPPPKMQGEEPPFALRDMRPIGIEMPQPAQQFSQTPSYMSQSVGASSVATPGMHAPQHSQTASGAHFRAGSTGQSYTSGQTGGVPSQPPSMAAGQTGGAPGSVASGPTGQPQFPDITIQLATKYGNMFKAANKDQAGEVPGGEVLRLLGTSPVDIAVKKQAWDMVAGGKGLLNAHEFFTMCYLLDVHIVNKSLPESIPSGIFPPGVHQCFSAAGLPVPGFLQPPTVAHVPLAQQNPVENLALAAEMHKDEKWSMEKHQEEEHDPLAALPSIPPKQTYEAPDEQPYNAESRLPAVDSKMTAALSNPSERERLQSSMKAATKLDRELHEAEVKFANAQQESEFYVASLQQLTIFKSRSERALLDTQSRADSAHREAQETRQRYEQMYANMRAQASTAQDLQRHITEAMASKAEWESKVAVLQQELQALANATPELLEQLQYEVEELKYAVGVSEAEKRAFEDQTAGLRASKAQLEDRVKTVRDEMKTAQELMEEAVISLNNAKQELDFTKTGEDAESLQAALEEAAAAYKALHIKALSAGVPVPKEAMIQSNEHSVWSKEDLIGARDWMKFADAGWTVMEDLPELPEIFDTTFYIAHNQSEPPEVIVPIIMSDDPFVEAEDIEDAPAPSKPAADSSVAAVPAKPAAAAAAEVPSKDEAAAPDADGEAAAAAPAAGEKAAAMEPAVAATPGAVAEAVEPPGAAAVDEANAAPTAAQPSAGPFNASSTGGASPETDASEPKGPAPLPADLFSGHAPTPDPEPTAPPAAAPVAAPALGVSAVGQSSFETFIPQDGSAPVSGDPSRTPSNAAGGLPTSVDISAQPSEALSTVSQSVQLPGLTGAQAGGAVGDTIDILKVAPTPAPTAELSLPLGPSMALGGPGSPPEITTDIQKMAPTPAPTAELSNSSVLPGAGRTVASLAVPSLAAAAAAAASSAAAGNTTDITTAAPTPAPTAELSNSTYLPGKPAAGVAMPSLAAAPAAASAGDTTDITTNAPTPAPTAELSNSSFLPPAGRTVDSMGVPSLAAAAAAAASSGAAAASGPLNGGQSGATPTISIPEQEDSVPMLAQGIPPTPGSTGALPTPQSRSIKSSLSGLAKHTSANGELSGALPGMSGRLMAPTPANSAALSMAGNSGLIDPSSGQPYPSSRGMPQRGTPLSISQVRDKLNRSDVGSGSSTNLATPTYDPGQLGSAPGPPPGTHAGPPGVLAEESTEILEISASLPLPQAPHQPARTSATGQGGTPPPVFMSPNPFAAGQQAAPDANDVQPPAPPGPVAEGTSDMSTSLMGGTDSVFGWPDAGAQSSSGGSGRKQKASGPQAAEQVPSKVTGRSAWNNEFQ